MSQRENAQMPTAPYPPMHFKPPQKSSLSSSPHYSTSYNSRVTDSTDTVSERTSSSRNTILSGRENVAEGGEEGLLPNGHAYPDSQVPGRVATGYASRIKFCNSWKDVVACINCISTTQPLDVQSHASEPVNTRKLGPVLLELRRVEVAQNSHENDVFFSTRNVALSRGNPQLGTSVSSTCLDVPPVESDLSQSTAPAAVATGLTTGMLCIHTFGSECNEEGLFPSSIEYYHTPRHHRQASAVAWRPNHLNHVAIGLLGSSTASGPQQGSGARRGGANVRAGGDREFCGFLWDIESQQPSLKRNALPMSKLSHNAPVASLAWVMDGQTLVVGSQSRNIQLYDMRVSGTNVPPISAYAHNFGVHGIEVDRHNPYLLATFCRAAGEPVRLWDIRRMDSVAGEIKLYNGSSGRFSGQSSQTELYGKVEALKWGVLEPGTLSVAVGDCVQDYDVTLTTRPVLVRVSHVNQGQKIMDIALYPGYGCRNGGRVHHPRSKGIVETLYPRRMLAVLDDRSINDVPKHGSIAPLAISRRDGRLVHALGPRVWLGSTTYGPCAMESSVVCSEEDISATMMRRSRCLRAARYSMNTSSNIKLLAADKPGDDASGADSSARLALLRLWSWIDRVESISTEAEEPDDDFQWPAKGLLDAGIIRLLRMDTEPSVDEITYSPTFSCNVYSSTARGLALTSCGWAGKFDLINVLAECEALDEYERSAALAVWHGNIGAAVDALQRASAAIRLQSSEKKGSDFTYATPEYAETLDLVAMCVAGFGGVSSSQSSVWRGACTSLLRRDDLSIRSTTSSRTVYLRAVCQFLLSVGRGAESRDHVLGNENLSLCDRVAFACRFLEQSELRLYILRCLEKCQSTGYIEGLVISGLTKEGIKILQAFVDKYADVQTAALVVSRVVLPHDWAVERRTSMEWVEAYRGLLNTWQMWQSRAMFDVDRADVLRRIKARGAEGNANRRIQTRRQGSRPPDPDVLASIPAQLDARCNYCSSPLGLRRHEGNANQWLSKMKPVLSCCPQCRKPLPRCAICLLRMGALNPYMELTRERTRLGPRGSGPSASPDDLFALANLPFAEWFAWCVRCKHGGHAHHLVGWFAGHESCPVSGCECRCQFDGIQKLSRPALPRAPFLGLGD